MTSWSNSRFCAFSFGAVFSDRVFKATALLWDYSWQEITWTGFSIFAGNGLIKYCVHSFILRLGTWGFVCVCVCVPVLWSSVGFRWVLTSVYNQWSVSLCGYFCTFWTKQVLLLNKPYQLQYIIVFVTAGEWKMSAVHKAVHFHLHQRRKNKWLW